MLPAALSFTTKFDFISTGDQPFVLTDTTDYAGEGISLADVKGCFKIEGPAGIIYNNTNFGAPDITGNVSLVFQDIEIPNDVDGNPVIGTYTITYTVLIGGSTEPGTYSATNIYSYCLDYVAPTVALTLVANCDCATVTSTDVTTYAINGVNPTITRVHKLFYPANLELTNLTGSGVILQAVYPNVYTGTYTGKVTSTLVYTFSDGLIVQWVITGSDEIQNDCTLSLCTVYCGMKKLTELYLQYLAVGNFGQAKVVFEQLMQIEIFGSLYYNARECGKPADAAMWIQKIMDVGNFDENCSCNDNTNAPIQVIPFCGGSGSGNTVIVAGDASFGTVVTSSVVGSTTTYTVRLTETYKDLILGALQSQDLSVTAFRAAGIPEEGRGVSTVSIPNGGGTLNLTVGVSLGVQVLLGSGTMTSSYTVALPTGSFVDGDSFTIIYNANKTIGGNNITLFGIPLTAQEAASGSTTVYGVYDTGTSTWYVSITGRTTSTASQQGLEFWTNANGDYALGSVVLWNMNPTFQYLCIQASGSGTGTNHPASSAINNTWWQYVGDKSILYDSSDNAVVDTTDGTVKIIPTPGSASGTEFLVREPDGTVTQTNAVQTNALPSGDVWKGNISNVATAETFNEAFSRESNISVPISGTTDTNVASGGATITLIPGTSKEHQVFNGTVTLAAAYTVTKRTPGRLVHGDHFWKDWKCACTTASNTVTLAGITLTDGEAISGNILVYAFYDLSATAWKAFKISAYSALPAGTFGQTLTYDSSDTLIASSALTNDGTNITVENAFTVGNRGAGSIGTNSTAEGIGIIASGSGSHAEGHNTTASNDFSHAEGNTTVASGINSHAEGNTTTASASYSHAEGQGTTANGSASHAEGTNTIAAGAGSHAEGQGTTALGGGSHAEGNNTAANASYSNAGGYSSVAYLYCQMARGSSFFSAAGSAQKSDIYFGVSTTNAVITQMFLDGASVNAVIPTGKTWGLNGTIIGRQVGGSTGTPGDSTIITFAGVLKNVSGTVSLVSAISPAQGDTDTGLSATAATITADNTNKALKIQVTGIANKNINWFCHVDLFEVGL